MKKIALTIAVLFSISISNIWAEETSTNASSVRYVKAPRFARPLVEKWITEYAKTQPDVEFQIAKGNQNQDNIALNIVFDNQNTEREEFSHVVYFGEFAVLPITASGSEAAKVLEGKHLNSKKLKQLYFLNDDFDEDVKKNKQFDKLVIYSGSNASSVATSFAHNFGEESSNFRGKRISGDDLFLNTALVKDPLGVSFNALPNIFDLKSRHIKDDLTIIGIDVKKSLEDSFSDKATLDELILALENGKVSEVAVEKIGVSFNIADDAVNQFLSWVLAQGTKYNHEYGLLNLDNKLVQAQINKVKTEFTAQNK
ncbi:MAG: hypothetical protein E7102_08290 [Prevotella ruminicola]|uniref:Uncharacterized protein n=1 Tax=Xylanibacter ruminicola TaxID=839 RepID=A0A928BTK2_XYLRU|nr:hypothetical protein [Xylanibacter ruminicola]